LIAEATGALSSWSFFLFIAEIKKRDMKVKAYPEANCKAVAPLVPTAATHSGSVLDFKADH